MNVYLGAAYNYKIYLHCEGVTGNITEIEDKEAIEAFKNYNLQNE